jgi:hypothetical protein
MEGIQPSMSLVLCFLLVSGTLKSCGFLLQSYKQWCKPLKLPENAPRKENDFSLHSFESPILDNEGILFSVSLWHGDP